MNNTKKILVIDDEFIIRRIIKEELSSAGYAVDLAEDGIMGFKLLNKNHYDLVILDNQMPGKKGIDLIKDIKINFPSTIVIMMTAYASIDNAVQAMKLGAHDYLTKPFENAEITEKVDQLLRIQDRLITSDTFQPSQSLIIGESESIKKIRNTIEKIKNLSTTVLLTGDSGTGKGVIANEIHSTSDRANKPFIHVNCAVLPATLIESELFGHVKGSFTGAQEDKKGKFESAEDGTIFLDEIGTLDHHLQAKLLTVLQERHFERIGSSVQIPLKARVLTATNQNLETAICNNTFREDLYYRLNVIHIECPTLRSRPEDILLMTNYFISRFNLKLNKHICSISDDVRRLFLAYRWPGNVRELENSIESALALSESDTLSLDDLPLRIRNAVTQSSENKLGNATIMEIHEYNEIIKALKANHGHREKTAQTLGMSRRTLQYKIKKYNILL
jgi:DNA-binding NtrC family response regulator